MTGMIILGSGYSLVFNFLVSFENFLISFGKDLCVVNILLYILASCYVLTFYFLNVQLRARRALTLFKDVLLRTRRVLSLYKYVSLRARRVLSLYNIYGGSALLVLNETLLNSVNALLALSRQLQAKVYNFLHKMPKSFTLFYNQIDFIFWFHVLCWLSISNIVNSFNLEFWIS